MNKGLLFFIFGVLVFAVLVVVVPWFGVKPKFDRQSERMAEEIEKFLNQYEVELVDPSLAWIAVEPKQGWLEEYDFRTDNLWVEIRCGKTEEGIPKLVLNFGFEKENPYYGSLYYEKRRLKVSKSNRIFSAGYGFLWLVEHDIFQIKGLSAEVHREINKIISPSKPKSNMI